MNFYRALKVYKRDWRSIARNPVAAVIMAGLCVIPSLYAWVNIQACWNVYENTGSIPVAVVNNDRAADFNGKKINIGNDVVGQLKKNHKIKWVFVGSREADLGLADSTYYAAIEIPADFSSKFLTVLSDHPQKPQILYKADTKVNPVAGKITESAKNTLVQEITSNFVTTVNETIFSSLNAVGKDADKNREDILKVKDAVIKINSGMDVITDSLDTVSAGSGNLNQLLDSVEAALPAIQSSLDVMQKSSEDTGAAVRSTGEALDASIRQVDVGLNYAQSSNERVRGLFADLNEAAAQGNSAKINSILPGIGAELDSMDSAVDATADYLEECRSADYSADIDSALASLQRLKTSLTNLKQQLTAVQARIENSSQNLDALYRDLNTAIPVLEQQLDAVDSSLQTVTAQLETLNQLLQSPQLGQLIAALKAIQTSGLKADLEAVLEGIKNSRADVGAALSALDASITEVNGEIDAANAKIDAASAFLRSVRTGNDEKKAQLSKIISSLRKIQPYLADEKTQFGNLRQQLNAANSIGKGMADAINGDSSQIAARLDEAMRAYGDGGRADLKTMAAGLTAAAEDASGLIRSAKDLGGRLADLVRTARGAGGTAATVSGDLSRRLNEFRDVIAQLGGKLELVGNDDIAQIIAVLQSNPQFIGSFMSDPFELKTESINAIPNYGSSMAPIYTTLALWVGCLLLNSILKTEIGGFEGLGELTVREKHFGKMMIFATLAMIQGLIVSLGDLLLLHVYAVNGFLFVMVCVVSSLVFSIITYTLVSTLGNVGKALSIIYMILQLAGSGGTYPIQVDPAIFRVLQPLFPFTYTVGGLREAVAGPLAGSVAQDFVLLFLFAAAFLLFGFFAVEPLRGRIRAFEQKFKESGLGE